MVVGTAVMEDIRRAFAVARTDHNCLSPWDRLFARDPRFADLFSIDLCRRERGWRGIRRSLLQQHDLTERGYALFLPGSQVAPTSWMNVVRLRRHVGSGW